MNTHLGWHYLVAGQNDQAIEQLKKTLELDKSFVVARHYLGQAYERKGMHQEAIAELKKVRDLYGQSQSVSGLLGHAYAVAGQRGEAQKIMEELKEQSKRDYVWPYNLAVIHVGLGEKDQAFERLEKACEDRSDDLIYLKVDSTFDPLRSDQRFTDLLRRLGLSNEEHHSAEELRFLGDKTRDITIRWRRAEPSSTAHPETDPLHQPTHQ